MNKSNTLFFSDRIFTKLINYSILLTFNQPKLTYYDQLKKKMPIKSLKYTILLKVTQIKGSDLFNMIVRHKTIELTL